MKNSKGKAILISISVWLLIVVISLSAVVGVGYGLYLIVDNIDSHSKPVIDVVTVNKYEVYDEYDESIVTSDVLNDNGMEKTYYRLYLYDSYIAKILSISDRNIIDSFTPDRTENYISDNCFKSYIDDKQNKVLNKLVSKSLLDEKGKSVKITPVLDDILNTVAKKEHEIMNMKIFNDNDDYYVYLEFNVNWSFPCELYHYDKESKSLDLIYQFDGEEIVGIKKIR